MSLKARHQKTPRIWANVWIWGNYPNSPEIFCVFGFFGVNEVLFIELSLCIVNNLANDLTPKALKTPENLDTNW